VIRRGPATGTRFRGKDVSLGNLIDPALEGEHSEDDAFNLSFSGSRCAVRISVIGAGPTGLFLAATLALREHRVTVVDRDPGPTPDGVWRRRGVMQFHHAHLFRPQCAETLQAYLPDAYQAWLEAGAEPIPLTRSDGTQTMFAVRSRRQTFETALRATVLGMPAVTFHRGHVDAVTTVGDRAAGVKVASGPIGADLVIDVSGRAGRVADGLRPAPSVGGNCGIAYVDRQYQLWPDAEPGPLLNPAAWQGEFDGYQSILFCMSGESSPFCSSGRPAAVTSSDSVTTRHSRRPAPLSRSSPRGRIRSAPDPSPMCFQAELFTTTTGPRPAQTAGSLCPG